MVLHRGQQQHGRRRWRSSKAGEEEGDVVGTATTGMNKPNKPRRRRRRPRPFGSSAAKGAVGLLFTYCCYVSTRTGGVVSALLQLDQVPNRMTNEGSATFTYVCTPLDVAVDDSCFVKVSVWASRWWRVHAAGAACFVAADRWGD